MQCATAMLEQLSNTHNLDFTKYNRTDSLRQNESPLFSKKSLSPLTNPIPSSVFNYRKGVYEEQLTADNLLTLTNSQSSMHKKGSNVLQFYMNEEMKLDKVSKDDIQHYESKLPTISSISQTMRLPRRTSSNHSPDLAFNSPSIEHLEGSFLQFERQEKRLVDFSKKIIDNPTADIVGERKYTGIHISERSPYRNKSFVM